MIKKISTAPEASSSSSSLKDDMDEEEEKDEANILDSDVNRDRSLTEGKKTLL